MEDIKRELRLTRFFCIVSSILSICLLAAIVFLVVSLQPVFSFVNETKPALEQFSKLDIDTLNRTMEQVDTSLGQVDWEKVADSLEQLDVEAINEAIRNLDTKELSTALEKLNKTTDALEAFGERLGSLSSLFGR
ncbi:MAG: hypothetical protein J1E64_04260 [Acetatifactor sp.]|nr:hypothetical protein [Acetatifactor sp.]